MISFFAGAGALVPRGIAIALGAAVEIGAVSALSATTAYALPSAVEASSVEGLAVASGASLAENSESNAPSMLAIATSVTFAAATEGDDPSALSAALSATIFGSTESDAVSSPIVTSLASLTAPVESNLAELLVTQSGIPLVTPTGSILSVRADLGVTTSGADVTAWADQSGAAHHYSNAGSGTYLQHDTTLGLPVIVAPDGNRRMPGHAGVATALLGDDNAYTIYGLFHRPTTGTHVFWGIGGAGGVNGAFLRMFATTLDRVRLDMTDGSGANVAVASLNNSFPVGWHAFCFRCHGTTVDVFVDSTSPNLAGAMFNSGPKGGGATNHVLAGRPPTTNGGAQSIAEFCIVPAASSDVDVAAKMTAMLAYKAAL